MTSINGFKPNYVWPNPAFPFRLYFEHEKVRVFIIENIPHNWDWLSTYRENIRKTDFFFVYCGWHHDQWFLSQARDTLASLGLSRDRFFYLFNSPEEMDIFRDGCFDGDLINHNAWLDENDTMKPMDNEKIYDAIYVGRRSKFKRHVLASSVKNLAIVAGRNHGNDISDIPPVAFINERHLKPSEVCGLINQSNCGLLLSAVEGACFASSEYLLCGIPVVSTHSKGGREVWYNEYNSIVCDPHPKQIADAVEYFKAHPRDPEVIRSNHIEEASKHRLRFIEAFGRVLNQHGVHGLDVHRYFYENYYHKMRKSMRPDFEAIFPPLP